MPERVFALSLKVVLQDTVGRCLLIRRSPQSKGNPGKWEFPGGKLDPGESIDQALRREVREETGLQITLDGLVGIAESRLPDRSVVYIIMMGHAVTSVPVLSHEHDSFQWVSPADLPGMDMPEQFHPIAARLAQGIDRI